VSGRADRPVPYGPYATEQEARADVAGVYHHAERSTRPGVLAEANLASLLDACERAGVILGAFDARIMAWIANYEPETCAAIAGAGQPGTLIWSAGATETLTLNVRSGPPPDDRVRPARRAFKRCMTGTNDGLSRGGES
jgi:hypothetical protein